MWRLLDYFGLAASAQGGFLGFENKPPGVDSPSRYDGNILTDNTECLLTKADLLDRFNVRHRPEITRSQQIGVTTFMIRINPESVAFIDAMNSVFEDRIQPKRIAGSLKGLY